MADASSSVGLQYSEGQSLAHEDEVRDMWIGLVLAVLSSLFIGSSFIIKKVSLQRLSSSGGRRAGAGGFGYLTQWLWWTGLLTMGAGEGLNFVAYAFAPAALVTPLGALSVLVSTLLSAYCLHETFNVLAKLGCALCVLGSTVVVLHAPHEGHVNTLAELTLSLIDPVFVWYVLLVLGVVAVVLLYYSPRYGARNVLVYLSVCSLLGAFSVLCCKSLGLIIKEGAGDGSVLISPVLWLSLLLLIFFVSVQMIYLNKALDMFATNVVTPIYYVLFTSSVLVASALLFKEWQGVAATDVLGILAGFFTTVIGVAMLHGFRDLDLSRLQLTCLLTTTNGSQAAATRPSDGVGHASPSISKSSHYSSRSSSVEADLDRMTEQWGADTEPLVLPPPTTHHYGLH